VNAENGPSRLQPILRPYDTVGSSRWVDFDTIKPTWLTDPKKSHVSHVVADTESWEQKMAQALEEMPEVIHYVKNQSLGFSIPYSINGEEKQYVPDFIVHFDDGHGPDDLLNLIIEVTGEKKKDKIAKVTTAKSLWVPAVNNHGGFGRWAFIEIADPWDAMNIIRAKLRSSL
jgi:type III restriction enzyme